MFSLFSTTTPWGSAEALTQTHRAMGETLVQDIVFVVVTILFFAIAIVYIRGCERLK
jgi:hypothetical protein